MKVTVIGGAGYVGLVTAVGLARLGHDVTGVDINQQVVDLLSTGKSPIHEDGLEPLLAKTLADGHVRFTTEMADAVSQAQIVFVAVGTPPHVDGSPDLTALRSVTADLARTVAPGTVVAIKSTVPVGAVSEMQETFIALGAKDIEIVSNPEFLSEGSAIRDFFHPSRIVVGTTSGRARGVMRELYAPFLTEGSSLGFDVETDVDITRDVPLVETSPESAQIIKYAANAFLATRVSFVNEIAGICEQLGADVTDVVEGLSMDPRIGRGYLSPGIGFGGPCLEKDLQALTFSAAIHGYQANFLEATLRRNDDQINHVVNRAIALCGGSVANKRIAVLGLAFKPGTNDVRTSLSVRIIDRLQNLGATVCMHDPVAIEEAKMLLPSIETAETPYTAAGGADLVMLLTDWPEYLALDWPMLASKLRSKVIFDGRNALDPVACTAAGLRYHGVGRAAQEA
jgi:UDPglucose 6-dehydrogenase